MVSNLILPLGPGKTLTICAGFFPEPGGGNAGAGGQPAVAFRDAIAQEDSVPGAAVQQGRPARAGDRGRCAVARANGVPQLHGLAYAYRGGSSRRAT